MCRMFALVAAHPVSIDPWLLTGDNALVRQCSGDHRGEQHHDGWGLGWYDQGNPTIVKGAGSAERDEAFARVGRKLRSRLVFAHVRQASVGTVTFDNCHPFAISHWLFMHNGTIERFGTVGRRMIAECSPGWLGRRRGSTDSELLLLWLLARAERAGIDVHAPTTRVSDLVEIVRDGIHELVTWTAAAPIERERDEPTRLNLVLSDGTGLLATRWAYDLTVGKLDDGSTLVASEPIGSGAWREFAEPSILLVSPAQFISQRDQREPGDFRLRDARQISCSAQSNKVSPGDPWQWLPLS